MAEQNAEISEEYALRLQKKGEWILIAVAFALMVLAIVALSVGMQYAPYVTRKVIDYETGATEIRNVGPRYGGYDEMLGGMITAVIANFVLFVILQPSIWVSKKTGEPSIISKILKAALHVLAVIAILIAVLVAGIGYMSASKLELIGTDSAGDPEYGGLASIWVLGANGMCVLGEVVTLLVYYWNERFAYGPVNASVVYMENHKKLLNRSERAESFTKFYIGVPYVGFLIGYFVSVLLASFIEDDGATGMLFGGGIQLIIAAVALVYSIFAFFKKHRLDKHYMNGYNKNHSGSGQNSQGQSSGGDRYDAPATDAKPVDDKHAKGKKRMASELNAYHSLKYVPEYLPTGVSNVWVTAELVNKDTFAVWGTIKVKGSVTCDIRREAPSDAAQELLDRVVANIESHALSIVDGLAREYSNYNADYSVECQMTVKGRTV